MSQTLVLRNCAGTNGREVPVEMSQTRVMVDPGNGTAMRFSEDDGWDFHCWSSESVCWAVAKDWKSMGSCSFQDRILYVSDNVNPSKGSA